MVISGTVHVRAKVDGGSTEPVSAQIAVEARNWSSEQVPHQLGRISLVTFNAQVPVGQRIPDMPVDPHHLGGFIAGSTILGSSDGVFDYVTDYGPNHGLAFFSRVPIELTMGVVVHPEMENRGRFYQRQAVTTISRECVRSGFPNYVTLILAHEGLPMNPQSHSGVFLREFQARALPAVEGLVFPSDALDVMSAEAVQRVTKAQAEADAVSDTEVDTNHPVRFGCTFSWR